MEDLGMINQDFWADKRVFLTGHTGFKGSWLSIWLQSLGAKVKGYALTPPTHPNLFTVANVADGMESEIGDIRDIQRLSDSMRKFKPEIVIHMAAQPLVRYSYEAPIETYATNVMGTVHLLDIVRRTDSVRAVVNITSDKCYENQEWPWGYRENEPMGGYDPYSNSKGCAELVANAYRRSYFNPVKYKEHGISIASARAGNVIGGGDWAMDRLIPDFLRSIEAGEPVRIRSPHAIRPWQYVLEPLSGYLLLSEKLYNVGPEYGEGWNFGPAEDDAKTVQWIVEKMTALWGEGANWELDNETQPHEAYYLKLDCSKARTRLGWHPRWSLDYALKKVINWQRVYLESPGQIRNTCLDQIEEYSTGD